MPNVYQPPTNNERCLEIEYDSDGKISVHPGEGDFCVYAENPPIRARCKIENPAGGTTYGHWVQIRKVPVEEFYGFCPGARPKPELSNI